MDAFAWKQNYYESAMQDADDHILRLLYADSASVISGCIEIISETARKYGIFLSKTGSQEERKNACFQTVK